MRILTMGDPFPSINVRRALSKVRQRWEDHSPSDPICLAEELFEGVTISDFCVTFLLSQRARRGKTPLLPPEHDEGSAAEAPPRVES